MTSPSSASLNKAKSTKDQIKPIFDKIDTVISDCDGVLWLENTAIQGSVEVINKLKALKKRVILLTNNSMKVREDFLLKARKMGFDIEKEDIISTAYLAALYLKNINFKKKVYVIGSKGIITELESAGIRHLGYGPDELQHSLAQTIENFAPDPDVGAVIIGFDEHFCYTKLLKAASYLNKPSCIFLATNTDERFPISSSLVMPGTGAIVRSVEAVAEKDAVIVGKPDAFIGEALIKKFQINPERTLIIGDKFTDIELGKNCGYQTMLVMSGATNLIKEQRHPRHLIHVPDFYVNKLGDLYQSLLLQS